MRNSLSLINTILFMFTFTFSTMSYSNNELDCDSAIASPLYVDIDFEEIDLVIANHDLRSLYKTYGPIESIKVNLDSFRLKYETGFLDHFNFKVIADVHFASGKTQTWAFPHPEYIINNLGNVRLSDLNEIIFFSTLAFTHPEQEMFSGNMWKDIIKIFNFDLTNIKKIVVIKIFECFI